MVELGVLGLGIINLGCPAIRQSDVQSAQIALAAGIGVGDRRRIEGDVVSDAQVRRRASRRIIGVVGGHADDELVAVGIVAELGTAIAVEALAVERDVLRQPLIDGYRGAIELNAGAVIGNLIRIEFVLRADLGVGGAVDAGVR